MSVGDDAEPLPSAIGDLVDLAFSAYRQQFALASLMSLGVFALSFIAELALPASLDRRAYAIVSVVVESLGASFVAGVVALSVAAAAAGTRLETSTLLRGAAYRWIGVFGAGIFASAITILTAQTGGFGPPDDPLLLVLAPVAWLLWGAVGLAAPIAALSPELPILSAFTSVSRSLMISLRVANLSRLAIVALATVVPLALESMLDAELRRRGVARPDFWSSLPIDCIVLGPLTALETVFALDFARRVAHPERPPLR